MNILIVTDTYPPMRTSGAIQVQHLAHAFSEGGHCLSVVCPNEDQKKSLIFSQKENIQLITVKALRTKDVGNVQRTFTEFINPLIIWYRLRLNQKFANKNFDLIYESLKQYTKLYNKEYYNDISNIESYFLQNNFNTFQNNLFNIPTIPTIPTISNINNNSYSLFNK